MSDIDPKVAAFLTPEGFARRMLAMRDEAAAALAEAEAAGNKKSARSYASSLRKLDKLIEQRGLKRFVRGA